jgi:hypothetical protein
MVKTELPPHPLMLATGTPVTPEQADHILVRTCQVASLPYSSSPDWNRQVRDIIGLPEKDWPAHGASYDERVQNIEQIMRSVATANIVLGVLPLKYIHNHRIFSNGMYGPEGWCDWDGVIGCGNVILRNQPTAKEFVDEWDLVAETFPFLDLRVQLLSSSDLIGTPIVEVAVRKGTARSVPPGRKISDYPAYHIPPYAVGRECGVTTYRLRTAVQRIKDERKYHA